MKAKLNYFSELLFNNISCLTINNVHGIESMQICSREANTNISGTKGAGITRQTVNEIVNNVIFINLSERELL